MHERHRFQKMKAPRLHASLAQRCPFYYGWLVWAIAASTNVAVRPLLSLAILSRSGACPAPPG